MSDTHEASYCCACLFWMSCVPCCGVGHRLCYLSKTDTSCLRIATFNYFGLGWLHDGCTMNMLVEEHNSHIYTALTSSSGRSDAESTVNTMLSRRAKIDLAAMGMFQFLSVVMSRQDRCSVSAFNDQYKPLVTLSIEEHCQACMVALTSMCTGGTNLYDAIVVSVMQFAAQADPSRPWLLIVLTDGEDTGSRSTLAQASEALRVFSGPDNNFAFLIGIGEDVKTREMQQLARGGNSLYVPLLQAEVLPVLFACIALQIQTGVRVDIASLSSKNAETIYARVQQTQSVSRNPVDILILCDVSGSMLSK